MIGFIRHWEFFWKWIMCSTTQYTQNLANPAWTSTARQFICGLPRLESCLDSKEVLFWLLTLIVNPDSRLQHTWIPSIPSHSIPYWARATPPLILGFPWSWAPLYPPPIPRNCWQHRLPLITRVPHKLGSFITFAPVGRGVGDFWEFGTHLRPAINHKSQNWLEGH